MPGGVPIPGNQTAYDEMPECPGVYLPKLFPSITRRNVPKTQRKIDRLAIKRAVAQISTFLLNIYLTRVRIDFSMSVTFVNLHGLCRPSIKSNR